MLNPLNLISRFIKSSNQKELDKTKKVIPTHEFFDLIKLCPTLKLSIIENWDN